MWSAPPTRALWNPPEAAGGSEAEVGRDLATAPPVAVPEAAPSRAAFGPQRPLLPTRSSPGPHSPERLRVLERKPREFCTCPSRSNHHRPKTCPVRTARTVVKLR